MKKKLFEFSGNNWYEDVADLHNHWTTTTLTLDQFLATDGISITIKQIIQQWDNHVMVFYDDIIPSEPVEL